MAKYEGKVLMEIEYKRVDTLARQLRMAPFSLSDNAMGVKPGRRNGCTLRNTKLTARAQEPKKATPHIVLVAYRFTVRIKRSHAEHRVGKTWEAPVPGTSGTRKNADLPDFISLTKECGALHLDDDDDTCE